MHFNEVVQALLSPSNPDPRGKGKENATTTDVAVPNDSHKTAASVEELKLRHYEEDIAAYGADFNFLQLQLETEDLTPQERRTIQLRILDAGHQVRYCLHQAEIYKLQGYGASKKTAAAKKKPTATKKRPAPAVSEVGPSTTKRIKLVETEGKTVTGQISETSEPEGSSTMGDSSAEPSVVTRATTQPLDEDTTMTSPEDDEEEEVEGEDEPSTPATGIVTLQRTGKWNCQLCISEKYRNAGSRRSPAMPCKAPLHDIAKMISHFLASHTEHEPHERCAALGAALNHNSGPFEYWLTHSKRQVQVTKREIRDCIQTLKDGELPDMLLPLHNAAGSFP